MTTATPQTGYAPVNGLKMYYEIHGDGGSRWCCCTARSRPSAPRSATLLPGLAKTRQVIALRAAGPWAHRRHRSPA